MNEQMLQNFERHLQMDERSEATVRKYLHDVRCFFRYQENISVCKQSVLDYKSWLQQEYALSSANSMLAALNAFFRCCGWNELCVKQFKVQKQVYCSEEKELSRSEYIRLLDAAKKQKKHRLGLMIQTICATGIRVSELQYITLESLYKGEAVVCCKGKNRRIFLVSKLKKKLLAYAKDMGIEHGPIFISKNGRPLDRSNVWKEMKSICAQAGVQSSKVFPHNLRHLFARIFYSLEKDIAKLADVLGHASIDTTRIYIISSGAEHKRQLEHMKLII